MNNALLDTPSTNSSNSLEPIYWDLVRDMGFNPLETNDTPTVSHASVLVGVAP
jgi:hypothetical protein